MILSEIAHGFHFIFTHYCRLHVQKPLIGTGHGEIEPNSDELKTLIQKLNDNEPVIDTQMLGGIISV